MGGERLPSGTVTFLFTDIEASTQTAAALGDEAWAVALQTHRDLLRPVFAAHGGVEVGTEGDAFFLAFPTAGGAVAAALEGQRALSSHDWPDDERLRVRMGMHTGEVLLRGGEYVGHDVHRAKRICDAGHGGQILLSEATTAIVRDHLPDATLLTDLGAHRLKDLAEPQHLYQLAAADLEQDFPGLRSLSLFRTNLPTERTSFVGRKREVEEVSRLLQSARLITLTGVGGTGKTRLALRVAKACADNFAHGAWFVDLAPLRDPELIPQAVATALGIVEEPGLPLAASIAARLHDTCTLIVLDNCEHLADAAAPIVDELLHAAPEVRVVATSREPLGVPGEHVWPLPPLGSEGEHSEAVELFAERAREARPDFELSDTNANAVVEICGRVDGLPLGIELLAARLRVLALDDLARRLRDRLDLPQTINRRRELRHRSLESAIEWSYDLLSETEAQLLCRLSVFAGGFSLEAAESVCADDEIPRSDVLALLSLLAEKSLIAVGKGVDGETRFRLLETVREFAGDRLRASGEEARLRDRHLVHYVRIGERAWVPPGGVSEPATLRRTAEELENLRAALSWSEEADPEAGLQLAGALGSFWLGRGHPIEGTTWLRRLLQSTQSRTPYRLRALHWAFHLSWRWGDYDPVPALAQQAIELARSFGVSEWTAGVLSAFALVAGDAGIHDRSVADEALAVARTTGNQRIIADALAVCALSAAAHGDRAARGLAEEAVHLSREIGLHALGVACLEEGDVATAQAVAKESLRIRIEGNEFGMAPAPLDFAACVAAAAGEAARAVVIAGAASKAHEDVAFAVPWGLREMVDRFVGPARKALGREATKLWAEGRGMSMEDAVAYALGERDVETSSEGGVVLTPREFEVAELLTEGLTNAEIGKRLAVSKRTVDAHVEHIRNKLGLRGRAQIAAWVTEENPMLSTST